MLGQATVSLDLLVALLKLLVLQVQALVCVIEGHPETQDIAAVAKLTLAIQLDCTRDQVFWVNDLASITLAHLLIFVCDHHTVGFEAQEGSPLGEGDTRDERAHEPLCVLVGTLKVEVCREVLVVDILILRLVK